LRLRRLRPGRVFDMTNAIIGWALTALARGRFCCQRRDCQYVAVADLAVHRLLPSGRESTIHRKVCAAHMRQWQEAHKVQARLSD
jgi:hypothetical protein